MYEVGSHKWDPRTAAWRLRGLTGAALACRYIGKYVLYCIVLYQLNSRYDYRRFKPTIG